MIKYLLGMLFISTSVFAEFKDPTSLIAEYDQLPAEKQQEVYKTYPQIPYNMMLQVVVSQNKNLSPELQSYGLDGDIVSLNDRTITIESDIVEGIKEKKEYWDSLMSYLFQMNKLQLCNNPMVAKFELSKMNISYVFKINHPTYSLQQKLDSATVCETLVAQDPKVTLESMSALIKTMYEAASKPLQLKIKTQKWESLKKNNLSIQKANKNNTAQKVFLSYTGFVENVKIEHLNKVETAISNDEFKATILKNLYTKHCEHPYLKNINYDLFNFGLKMQIIYPDKPVINVLINKEFCTKPLN